MAAFKMNGAVTLAAITLGLFVAAGKVDFGEILGVAKPNQAVAD